MGERLSFAGMLLCVAVILYLAYWCTRRIAAGNLGRAAAGRQLQVCDRLALGPNKALVVARVGTRWLVLGVAGEQISLLAELTEEQAQLWQQAPPGGRGVQPSKFADILSDVLRGKNKKP